MSPAREAKNVTTKKQYEGSFTFWVHKLSVCSPVWTEHRCANAMARFAISLFRCFHIMFCHLKCGQMVDGRASCCYMHRKIFSSQSMENKIDNLISERINHFLCCCFFFFATKKQTVLYTCLLSVIWVCMFRNIEVPSQ